MAIFNRVVVGLRWPILIGWIVAAVVATTWLPSLAGTRESPVGGLVDPDSPAIQAERRSLAHFGFPLFSRVAVVERSPDGITSEELASTVALAGVVASNSAPELRQALRESTLLEDLLDEVEVTESPVEAELDEIPFAMPLVNSLDVFPRVQEDATTAISFLAIDEPSLFRQQELAEAYAAQLVRERETTIGVTGTIPGRLGEWRAIRDALPWVEAATVVLIALILLWMFRSPGVPLLTLAAAGIAYLISIRLAAVIGLALGVSIPREAEPVLVVLLLGIATDYAVFLLAAGRRRLANGEGAREATLRTMTGTVPIVATAGLIVCLGTAALLVGRLDFFRALGPGLAVSVLTTLAVCLTFIPACLAILGRALFWPSIGRTLAGHDVEETAWPAERLNLRGRLARFSVTRPGALLMVATSSIALLAAASGLLFTNLGFVILEGLPRSSEARVAGDAAAAGFAPGILSPTELLVEGKDLESRQGELERLELALARQRGLAIVAGPRVIGPEFQAPVFVADGGSAARYLLVLEEPPLGAAGIDRLRQLRGALDELAADAGLSDARLSLLGDTAIAEHTVSGIVDDLWRILAVAVIINLLLLALFLRSLIAPLYLVATSLLALAASLGLTTYLFQGLLARDGLTYYVPFAVTVLLLSLGSDYNVFIVGRIWQQARRQPLEDAVAYATPRAARAVTVAGVALAGSFALLALIPLDAFRQFAFAMGVGILVDTFLVRTMLVPSLVALVGEASWWPARRFHLREALQAPDHAE